jgi:hypothetical protein
MPSVSIVIFVVLVIMAALGVCRSVRAALNERILPQPRSSGLQSRHQYFSKTLKKLFDFGESAT